MPHTQTIDETAPAGTDPASGGALEFRNLKRDIRERMALEHVWTGADTTSDGAHALLDSGESYLRDMLFQGWGV